MKWVELQYQEIKMNCLKNVEHFVTQFTKNSLTILFCAMCNVV